MIWNKIKAIPSSVWRWILGGVFTASYSWHMAAFEAEFESEKKRAAYNQQATEQFGDEPEEVDNSKMIH